MTIGELNNRLDVALRTFIRKRDHILTGALYKSVIFNCTETETGLSIKFSSKYYIQFLDHGDFIQDFYNLDSTMDILQEYVAELLEGEL